MSDKNLPPAVAGKAQYAARARTRMGGDVWFTIGQAWGFLDDGDPAFTIRLAMTPTDWDGEMILVKIPPETDDASESGY